MNTVRAGDLFAGRYRLTALLAESGGGRFWRARDEVLARSVALHLASAEDSRADALMEAARRAARIQDRRLLRVLDADRTDEWCWVVNEWGEGVSLDLTLADTGPLSARRAAWLVQEFTETLAVAHAAGQVHGRVVPENLLVDNNGQVRVIGLGVDAALRSEDPGTIATDVADAGALLYAALTARWPGRARSGLAPAPTDHGVRLRARQVQAGVPRTLDLLCEQLLTGSADHAPRTAQELVAVLADFVGDPQDLRHRRPERPHRDVLRPRAPRSVEDTVENLRLRDLPSAGATPDAAETAETDPMSDLSWLTPRADAPPAPELPEVEARPLFAPEPRPVAAEPRGHHVASPDHEVTDVAPLHDENWPWDDEVADDEVPGRSWFRLAVVVGLLALVLLCSVAVKQVLDRNDDSPAPPESTQTATPRPQPVPVRPSAVFDFDPEGTDGGTESPNEVPLATDGDPETAWRTAGYYQNFTDANRLKSGVGLLLDLGKPRDVTQVAVRVLGGRTSASLYLFQERPTNLQGAEPVSTQTALENLRFSPAPGTEARWAVVWLTSLPNDGSYYRGQIAEIKVLARP